MVGMPCRSSLECSKQHLLQVGAVTADAAGHLSATRLGHLLAALPLRIEFGISILAAMQHQCSLEVAIIACMATRGGNRVFQHSAQSSESEFAAVSVP